MSKPQVGTSGSDHAVGVIETNRTERTSAVSLSKVRERAPDLVNLYKSAGAGVRRHGLEGVRAAVYLVLDRSGSMRPYYADGTVQHLAEQVLTLSAHLDDDGTVPVVFFSTDVDGSTDLRLGGHRGRINKLHENLGHMGRTNYHWAMDAVIDHYIDSGSDAPALVIFQTDGGPTSRPAAERYLCKSARLPLFWQFIGFGDPADNEFAFLRKLDSLAVPAHRVVDNAGFFHAGRSPLTVDDDVLFDRLLQEFPDWLAAARTAGIV
ncbi:vWA domain-containing protein [Streptomyces sp. NPDC090306]|uniref:vWA domain-containing protein n=1 Tax=Streptomyces sp. NPDC090306 TaxID=3365961 RepID=UPI0038252A4A